MEIIASSRIGRARKAALELDPYAQALTRSLAAVAAHSAQDHALLDQRTDTNKVGILVVAADRGMAGAYTATILRETEKIIESLESEGKQAVLYVAGRRAESYFRFRGVDVRQSWAGFSDRPDWETSRQIADRLLSDFIDKDLNKAISQLHVVYTTFVNSMTQTARIHHLLPIQIVTEDEVEGANLEVEPGELLPLYEFEPSAAKVLDFILPVYVRQRIYALLLMSAASELASRQRAMHTATDNAQDLIRKYTRLYNNARQSAITTELTEIISGADALSNQR